MTLARIPFSKPSFDEGELAEIGANIKLVLRSGRLTSGPMVERFEEEFSRFTGSRHAVAMNSCTAALHAILCALGVSKGDEVIVPSNTFVATANAALYQGATPVFADCDDDTFNVSPADIERKITKKTKAMIVVHLGGNPCDMDEITEISERHSVPIVEDCAHAHGAKFQGKNCGTIGVAGAFSFYPSKIFTTAEGGMVVTDSKEMAEKLRILRNHGRAEFGPSEVIELGYNYRLSDVHAVLGISQLKHVDRFLEHRKRIADLYNEGMRGIGCLEPQLVRKNSVCSYYAYLVKIDENAPFDRDELLSELNGRGVDTSILYHPIHLQPLYRRLFGYRERLLPVTEKLGRTSFGLPLYNDISFEEARHVLGTLRLSCTSLKRRITKRKGTLNSSGSPIKNFELAPIH